MKIEYTKILDDVTIKIEVKFDKIDDDLFKLLSFLDFSTRYEKVLKKEFKNDDPCCAEENNPREGYNPPSKNARPTPPPLPPRPYKELIKQ